MVVVRIEIWPHGDARLVQQIGMMTISNITPNVGEAETTYEVRIDGKPGFDVKHFRKNGIWRLVKLALKKV